MITTARISILAWRVILGALERRWWLTARRGLFGAGDALGLVVFFVGNAGQ